MSVLSLLIYVSEFVRVWYLVFNITWKTQVEDVWELGVVKNAWTEEELINKRL
jgi:hypothetical protein